MMIFVLLVVSLQSIYAFEGEGTAYTLGTPSSGNCNFMDWSSDSVVNYAALNDPQWDGLKNCGACAKVWCSDSRCKSKEKVLVHILDRCPECKKGDLDLSPQVFKKITGSHPARYHVQWEFAPCPVSGSVNICLKKGSNNFWTGVQPTNSASKVQSVTINGKSTKMLESAYYFLAKHSHPGINLQSVEISLTSTSGEVIKNTISLKEGGCTPLGKQFSGGKGNVEVSPKVTPPPKVKDTASPKVEATTEPKTESPDAKKSPIPGTTKTTPSVSEKDSSQSSNKAKSDSSKESETSIESTAIPKKNGKQSKEKSPNSNSSTNHDDRKETDGSQTANTKSDSEGTGTSAGIIILLTLAGVMAIGVVAAGFILRRKKLGDAEKQRDLAYEPACLDTQHDSFSRL